MFSLLFFIGKKKVYTEKLVTFLRTQVNHSRCQVGTEEESTLIYLWGWGPHLSRNYYSDNQQWTV